jgi:hypothetical protein
MGNPVLSGYFMSPHLCTNSPGGGQMTVFQKGNEQIENKSSSA